MTNTPENRIAQIKKKNEQLRAYIKQLNYWETSLKKTQSSIFYRLWLLTECIKKIVLIPYCILVNKFIFYEIKNRSKNHTTILNFGVVPYCFRHLRQQHLVEYLAQKNYQIFYIEPEFTILRKKEKKIGFTIKKYSNNIYIINLFSDKNTFIFNEKPKQKTLSIVNKSLRAFLSNITNNKIIVKIDYPFWAIFLKHFKMPIIYDCIDYYEGFKITGPHILLYEKQLFQKSKAIIACSKLLKTKIEPYCKNRIYMVENAGEFNHFYKARKQLLSIPHDMRQVKKPIVGYFGAVADWIDSALLNLLTKSFPTTSVVLIGENTNMYLKNIVSLHPNLLLLGEKTYSSLPNYLQLFDVCIIPFKVTKTTKLTNPVKLYEYFASGKPVVTTDITEIYKYRKVCYISKNYEEFIENIKKALNEPKNIPLRKKRIQIARENTWEKRGEQLDKIITQILKLKT